MCVDGTATLLLVPQPTPPTLHTHTKLTQRHDRRCVCASVCMATKGKHNTHMHLCKLHTHTLMNTSTAPHTLTICLRRSKGLRITLRQRTVWSGMVGYLGYETNSEGREGVGSTTARESDVEQQVDTQHARLKVELQTSREWRSVFCKLPNIKIQQHN